jgi:hypothetical protein
MTGSFERWFKQCDESILNDAARATFGNFSLGKTPWRTMSLARKTGTKPSIEAGNAARQ